LSTGFIGLGDTSLSVANKLNSTGSYPSYQSTSSEG
jgi:hypothetical protein